MLIKALNTQQNLKLKHFVADQLLSRLSFIKLQPRAILDFGFTDHYLLEQLKYYYQAAKFYTLLPTNFTKIPYLVKEIDLIISNLAIDLLDPAISSYLHQMHQISKDNGILLFSIFNNNINNINNESLINIGNLLILNNFHNAVIDRELINVHYQPNLLNPKNSEKAATKIEIIYGYATAKH